MVSIAFHPSVVDEYGLDCPSLESRSMLINLALDFVCDVHKVTLSRDHTILSKEEKCKGSLIKAQESITKKVNGSQEQMQNELGDLEKLFGPMAAGCTDTLMSELSNIACGKEDAAPVIPEKSSSSEIKLPFGDQKQQKTKKGLIVEMDADMAVEAKPVAPEYELTNKEDRFVLKIKLLGVSSVAECQLDISQVSYCFI